MKNIFPDCTQTVRSGEVFVPEQDWCAQYHLFPHNFAAGRDGWVIPNGKMPSGLYKVVRPADIFLLGIGQSPGPPEIINLLLSVICCKFEPGRDAEVVPG